MAVGAIEVATGAISRTIRRKLGGLKLSHTRTIVHIVRRPSDKLFNLFGGGSTIIRINTTKSRARSIARATKSVALTTTKTTSKRRRAISTTRRPKRGIVNNSARRILATGGRGHNHRRAPFSTRRRRRTTRRTGHFLANIFGKVGVRIRLRGVIGRRHVLFGLRNRNLNVLVKGRNRALSTLRCLAGLTTGGGFHRRCFILLSIRSCQRHHERALRSLTRHLTSGIGHAKRRVHLRPVSTNSHHVVRLTLRGSNTMSARDSKRTPCHYIIVHTGRWGWGTS